MKWSFIFIISIPFGCHDRMPEKCPPPYTNPLPVKVTALTDSARTFLKSINPYKLFLTSDQTSYIFPDSLGFLYLLKGKSIDRIFESKRYDQLPAYAALYAAGDNILEYDKLSRRGVFLYEKDGEMVRSPDTLHYAIAIPPQYYNIDRNSVFLVRKGDQYVFMLNYGITAREVNINFLDSSVFYYVSSDSAIHKIGKYPRSFFKDFLPQRETLFAADTAGNLYYAHALYDSVYRIDLEGNTGRRNAIYACPKRKRYQEKDLTDLTYLREFTAQTEINVSILLVNNRYLVILKKLAQKEVIDKPVHRYFVYDKELRLLYSDTIPEPISPKLFPARNGFFVVDEKVQKIFSYEIH